MVDGACCPMGILYLSGLSVSLPTMDRALGRALVGMSRLSAWKMVDTTTTNTTSLLNLPYEVSLNIYIYLLSIVIYDDLTIEAISRQGISRARIPRGFYFIYLYIFIIF
jgi:hypothetical protein